MPSAALSACEDSSSYRPCRAEDGLPCASIVGTRCGVPLSATYTACRLRSRGCRASLPTPMVAAGCRSAALMTVTSADRVVCNVQLEFSPVCACATGYCEAQRGSQTQGEGTLGTDDFMILVLTRGPRDYSAVGPCSTSDNTAIEPLVAKDEDL